MTKSTRVHRNDRDTVQQQALPPQQQPGLQIPASMQQMLPFNVPTVSGLPNALTGAQAKPSQEAAAETATKEESKPEKQPEESQRAGYTFVPMFQSPFAANINMFDGEKDNEASLPDLAFLVRGLDAPLKLHRCVLCVTSDIVHDVLKFKSEKDRGRLEWPFDTVTNKDRVALVKMLRYCYGEPLSVEDPKQIPALIAAANRLQIRNVKELIAKLESQATLSAVTSQQGLELLKECLKYEECCRAQCVQLDAALLGVVLPQTEVPEDVLAKLKPCCVDAVKYRDVHCEFQLRARIAAAKKDAQEKRSFMDKIDTTQCSADELTQLREMGIYTDEEMFDKAIKALAARDKHK